MAYQGSVILKKLKQRSEPLYHSIIFFCSVLCCDMHLLQRERRRSDCLDKLDKSGKSAVKAGNYWSAIRSYSEVDHT